ncbi:hypothetical protein AAC387_Pa03g0348 [Persea americana]
MPGCWSENQPSLNISLEFKVWLERHDNISISYSRCLHSPYGNYYTTSGQTSEHEHYLHRRFVRCWIQHPYHFNDMEPPVINPNGAQKTIL